MYFYFHLQLIWDENILLKIRSQYGKNTTRTFTSESGRIVRDEIRSHQHRERDSTKTKTAEKNLLFIKQIFMKFPHSKHLITTTSFDRRSGEIAKHLSTFSAHKSVATNDRKSLCVYLAELVGQAGEQNVMAIENIIFVRKWNFADFFFLFPSHEMRKKNSQNVWDTKSFHFSLILKLSEFTSWTHFVLAREVKNFPLRKIFWNHRVDL